jgi:hypothetical protein
LRRKIISLKKEKPSIKFNIILEFNLKTFKIL